ncbi:MAG TPA: hypothetical protein VES36_07165 [Candidatus Limnocylindrales bacterium]|nr:hypothetical protein [Candidatus Limnocylindrales bacterium]
MVLPRARGLDSRETLSSKLIVGLTSGAVVAVWVVLTIRPSGPADKAHLYWVLLYSAIAGLGVAVHQASTVIWRRGAT